MDDKGPFDGLGLNPTWVAALADQAISQPTEIQQQAIPVVLQGKDTYISAETGTGKTLAYLLPLLERLDASSRNLQVVILAPTLELALQIHEQVRALTTAAGSDIRSQALIGGVSFKRQLEQLKAKPHLIAGTPERVLELISSRKLKMHEVRCVVIDEADRLLVDQIRETVESVIRSAPSRRQLVFVSATQQAQTSGNVRTLAPDLLMVDTGGDKVSATIEHLFVIVEQRKKPEMLRRLIHATQPERALVFVHRNTRAEELADKLGFHDLRAVWIHGAADRMERKQAMEAFRRGDARVLISSDLAARGLDLPGVTHVFNLDPPTQSQDYLHRAGRTGRAAAAGCSILLLDPQEQRLVSRYTRDLGIELQAVRLAGGALVRQAAGDGR
ncbi:MAG: DEAD/DEAH box helicase [bacterium]|nr:DEAD/DEAH box helicase [bacterium]